MNSTIAFCLLIAATAVWVVLIAAAPSVLSDKNEFLRGFVNHEFLNFMGVVVAISIATTSNIYIELNKFQERTGHPFSKSKRNIRMSAYSLLWALLVGVIVVVVRPLTGDGDQVRAFWNGAALMVMLFAGLILTDIIQAAFGLDANKLNAPPASTSEEPVRLPGPEDHPASTTVTEEPRK